MGNKQSNWHKREQPPRHGQCQAPNCEGVAEKKYKFPDGGFAHYCLDHWREWINKELSGSD